VSLLFSTNFRNAYQSYGSSPAPLFTTLDVAFNGSGTRRFSDDVHATAMMAVGSSPRLSAGAIGAISSSVSQRAGDLGRQTHSVKLIDTDRALSSLAAGRYDIRRSPVTFKWGLPGLVEADWFTAFTGVVNDWSWSAGEFELQTSTDDRVLRGYVPNRQILKGWAPNAPQSRLGLYVPIVIGIHDGQGLTGRGMLPMIPYCIDATMGYWYLVSLGAMKSVPRVYKGATALSSGTGANQFQVSNIWRGGMYMTVVQIYSPSPVLTDADVLTCDVEGTQSVGGVVITNPVEQLKWMLNNVIYNDWGGDPSGTFSTAPTDDTLMSTAAAYAAAFKYEGSRYIGGTTEQSTGSELLSSWMKSHINMRARWSNLGRLGVFPIDHRYLPYAADYVFDGEEFDRVFSFKTSSEGLSSKVKSSYLYGEADSKYWMTLEVQDLARWQIEKITESFDLSWSASRFQ
jgi:hypothetical protein